jgi:hypothetical protein
MVCEVVESVFGEIVGREYFDDVGEYSLDVGFDKSFGFFFCGLVGCTVQIG